MPTDYGGALPQAAPTTNPIAGWNPSDPAKLPQMPPTPGSDGGSGGGGSTAAPAPSSYSIGNDPAYLIAQNWASQQNAFEKQALALAGHSSSSGYTSQAGIKSAQLQYQLAQQQDQAQKDQATHQLPLTILQIVNQLAAHGVGNSGDGTFLPGEAKYAYDNVLQGLQQDLAAKAAQVQLAQADYQAAAAANASQASQANANELARAQLAYQQAVAQNNHELQNTAVGLYQQAVQNGYALDPGSLALLKSLGGG